VAILPGAETECGCGLPFPTFEAIIGRVDDILYTPDRGYVGRLDTVFKKLPNSIIEAQIIQTAPEQIMLRLAPDKARYEPAHAELVVKEMRKRLGDVVRIDIDQVDMIERSANGKMRPVVNLCGDQLPAALRYDVVESI
jgi:phenylacetate-CoA ligase